jgi:hypothetical protein
MSSLEILSWLSIGLGLATALVIALDERKHPQSMRIMNIVWPVTGLYFPLIGIWFYRSMGRTMAVDAPKAKGQHAHWQSIFLSATHCGAGCVIGDILGAPLVYRFRLTLLGSTLLADYAAEFIFAYILGIAFQYVPIRSMQQVPPAQAIWDAVRADTLSLIAFEVGMFGWMAFARYVLLPEPVAPNSVVFWFMMQIGMIFGFLTTYPANWLLVKWGIKSGM